MKKIFALVLSLCMVLSTFVAVSAQEQVWNEGTPFTETTVSAGSDFENGLGTMFVGDATLTASAVTVDGRNAIKVDHTANNAYTTVIGFEFKDNGGNKIDLYDTGAGVSSDAVINWSIDVKMEDNTTSAPVLVLRDGTNPPSGQSVNLKNIKTEANGEWQTFSGTATIGDLKWAGNDATWTNLTVRFYPSAAGTVYFDNMSATITEKSYYDELGAEDKSLASSGLEYGPQVTTVSYANGYADATLTGTGNNSMVGTWLRNTDGTKYVPQVGDKVVWSVDINPSADFTLNGGTARGVIIRTGGAGSSTSLTPSGNYQRLTTEGTAPANTWTSLSGSYIIPSSGFDVSGWTGICIRTEFTGSIKVKNLNYSIRRDATTVVETGWGTPDYSIDYTAQKALSNIGTIDANGDFTADIDDIEAHNNGNGNCSYQPWIWLNTSIPAGKQFVVSYDFTSEGINNSLGNPYDTLTVRTRFYNASGNEINSGYRPSATLTANTGEPVHYELNVDTAQLTQDIASVRLVVDVDTPTKFKLNDEGAYFTLSNITLSEVSKVALSAAKTANGVDLTLANNNAEDCKFSGRLLIAEYKTVDGVKELVQFNEVAVDEEIEAGNDAVVTAEFEENIAAGNQVYVFVWEPASFDAITMFVK